MGHYDKDYFEWQKPMGKFGGTMNLFKFEKFIGPGDKVIEFGCGGAYLLENITCSEKIGIEINPSAREEALKRGLKVVESADMIDDEWADIIISDNVLEHTFDPLGELKRIYTKLKKGGKIVFVLPHEHRISYKPGDINQHLYSWSPMCAGNLFASAGYHVESVDYIWRLWPPLSFKLYHWFGKSVFDMISVFYGVLFGKWHQIRVVAVKK